MVPGKHRQIPGHSNIQASREAKGSSKNVKRKKARDVHIILLVFKPKQSLPSFWECTNDSWQCTVCILCVYQKRWIQPKCYPSARFTADQDCVSDHVVLVDSDSNPIEILKVRCSVAQMFHVRLLRCQPCQSSCGHFI